MFYIAINLTNANDNICSKFILQFIKKFEAKWYNNNKKNKRTPLLKFNQFFLNID